MERLSDKAKELMSSYLELKKESRKAILTDHEVWRLMRNDMDGIAEQLNELFQDEFVQNESNHFYTLAKLKAENGGFDRKYGIKMDDVIEVNKVIETILTRLVKNPVPVYGDRVKMVGREVKQNGIEGRKVYEYGLVHPSHFDKKSFSLCTNASIPFVSMVEETNFRISASGGYWVEIPKSNVVEYNGTTKGVFCIWGNQGACAQGSINFYATVNYWTYQDDNKIY